MSIHVYMPTLAFKQSTLPTFRTICIWTIEYRYMYLMYIHIFLFRTTYKDDVNQSVSDVLVKEVCLQNPTFLDSDVRGKLI